MHTLRGMSWEKDVSTNIVDALGRVVKRLPEVWRLRKEAESLVHTLPRFGEDLDLPDAGTIYSWIEELCATPHRRPGTAEGHLGETYVADQFRAIGLEDVTLDPVPLSVWDAERWSLSVAGVEIPSFFVLNTAFTSPDGVSAPLVYVGKGRPSDFEEEDVEGKIVVAEVPFPRLPTGALMRLARAAFALSDPHGWIGLESSQYLNYVRQNFLGGAENAEEAPEMDVYWQAQKRGAVGICLILRDQPSNSNSHYGPYDGIMKPMSGLWIGKHDGKKLRSLARARALATLKLEGTEEPGVMHNIWGTLPGRSEEIVLVTSHHDAPFEGAVEDAAGVAQVLAQAWAWSRVPKEKRPKTLVFIVDAGHFYGSAGAFTFARQHPEIMERTRILLTLEHLAGREVVERDGRYEDTGRLAFTVMFTSPQPEIVAAVQRALHECQPPATAAIPSDFFGPAPTSDALGYVFEAGLPVVSWIGCPYYLLDEHDTLDKVDRTALVPIAETATELVKSFMAM